MLIASLAARCRRRRGHRLRPRADYRRSRRRRRWRLGRRLLRRFFQRIVGRVGLGRLLRRWRQFWWRRRLGRLVMDLPVFRHSLVPHWWARRTLPPGLLARIEPRHRRLGTAPRGRTALRHRRAAAASVLLAGQTSRERAIDLSRNYACGTPANSGVLIYVQLVDRKVEIVTDRGIHTRVGQGFWEGLPTSSGGFSCRSFRDRCAGGDCRDHRSTGQPFFSPDSNNPNELPDQPLVL